MALENVNKCRMQKLYIQYGLNAMKHAYVSVPGRKYNTMFTEVISGGWNNK